MTATQDPTETVYAKLDQLHPHPDNWRGKLDKAGLAELAESLKVRQDLPCIVRPQPGGKHGQYQLLDGHRRHAAAKLAKLALLRCEVQHVDDLTALEIIGRSHIQRENVTALEEAAGLEALRKAGWDGATMAAELGKSATWVARRTSLLQLAPDIRKAAAEGGKVKGVPMPYGGKESVEGLEHWPARSLELLASVPAETQPLLLGRAARNSGGGPMHPDYVRRAMADMLHVLSAAAFDKSDPTLNPKQGACTACDLRASCRKSLFDDAPDAEDGKIPRNDVCLYPACFEIKTHEHAKRKVADAVAEHGNAVVVVARGEPRFPGVKETIGYLYDGDKQAARAGDKGAQFFFDVASGKGKWLAPRGRSSYSSPGKKTGPTPLKTRKHELRQRRLAHCIKAIEAEVEKWDRFPTDGAWGDLGTQLLALMVFGCCDAAENPGKATVWKRGKKGEPDVEQLDPFELVDELKVKPEIRELPPDHYAVQMAALTLFDRLHGVLLSRIRIWGGSFRALKPDLVEPECARLCEIFQLDWPALQAEAVEECPEPKGWAKLNADGTPKAPKTQPLAKSAKGAKQAKAVGAQRAAPAGKNQPDILADGAELQEDGSVKIKKGKGKRRPKARAGGK